MYNSNEIESKILYILLNAPEKQEFIISNLEKVFFADYANSLIFEQAKKLYQNGEDINTALIADKLRDENINLRLFDINCDFAISAMTEKYCQILFSNFIEKLIKNAKTEADYEQIKSYKEHYLFNERKIFHCSKGVEDFEKNYNKRKNATMVTFYPKFDEAIGSFMGGDYIALGGSTGTGKTSIALNFARRACMQDKTVLYFSLEMTLNQLQNRFVCMNEELSANKYRSFGFNLIELQRYKQGLENLKQWDLYIVADYNLTVEKIRAYVQQQKNKKLDFVVIDYLGLISGFNNKTVYERTTMISRKLKLIATEFDVPILVLVQLNRDLKNRNEKRPILSDIRESGAIEQDSDYVLFAHRPYIYDRVTDPSHLELIIAKNRHGTSNCVINFDFNLSTQLLTESERKWN